MASTYCREPSTVSATPFFQLSIASAGPSAPAISASIRMGFVTASTAVSETRAPIPLANVRPRVLARDSALSGAPR